jgi:hypothetical protein
MSESWYVDTLLRGAYMVRELITTRDTTGFEQFELTDLEDTDYNNLLLIEKTLEDLKNNNQLSAKEVIILNKVLEYKSLSAISRETGINRAVLSKFFEMICDRVAFILGDVFTNDGYLDYITKRNGLTEEQVEIAREYMNSNKRCYILEKTMQKRKTKEYDK